MIGSIFKLAFAFMSADGAMDLLIKLLGNLLAKNPKLKEEYMKFHVEWEKRNPDAVRYRAQYQDAEAGLEEMERERQAKANAEPPRI